MRKQKTIKVFNVNHTVVSNIETFKSEITNGQLYIVPTYVIELLQTVEMPISNRRIFIKNCLDFFAYLDTLEKDSGHVFILKAEKIGSFFTMKTYTKYLDIFKAADIFSLIPYADGKFAIKGVRFNKYRFFNKYVRADLSLVILEDDVTTKDIKFTAKISDEFKDTLANAKIDTNAALVAEIKHYHQRLFNKEKTEEELKTSLRYRVGTIFNFGKKIYAAKGDNSGRVYHNLSNLSRVSRKYVTIYDRQFHNIDIGCCQPTLMAYQLIKNNLPIDDNYIKDVEGSKFYQKFETSKRNYSAAKEILYATIFMNFSPNHVIAKKFRKLYPVTFDSILKLTELRGGESMAKILQSEESRIFNNLKPNFSNNYYTLYDAIYFTDERDIDIISKELKSEFAKLNLYPTLKINL